MKVAKIEALVSKLKLLQFSSIAHHAS